MAFTTAEASAIRFALGYPDLWRYLNTRLEAAIEIIGNDADASARVRLQLAELATLNGSSYFQNLLLSAGLKKADEVEWYPGMKSGASAPMAGVMERGRMLCAQLSITFGVPINADIFDTQGFPGDDFMGPSVQGSNGGIFSLG